MALIMLQIFLATRVVLTENWRTSLGFSPVLAGEYLRPCYTKKYFLQLATQRRRMENHSSCRRGVTRLQFFSQLATRTITNKMAEISRERKMSSDWPILTKLRCKLLRGCSLRIHCYFDNVMAKFIVNNRTDA